MTLIFLEYAYEGVVAEGRGGDELLVGCICNQVNEVIYGLVDFFRGKVWGRERERA